MSYNKLKKIVSLAALKYIKINTFIGVGSGSTVTYFINALNTIKHLIKGVVSSSEKTSIELRKLNIPIFDLNQISNLDTYVDSADEINNNMQMIKGKGGALTKEKIIASAAKKFICIIDESKYVSNLGKSPIPIEVIPIAKTLVSKKLIQLGGLPKYRQNFITDNGNIIIDIYNLNILNAILLEKEINNIPGVVSVGIFAQRVADILLISNYNGVKSLKLTYN